MPRNAAGVYTLPDPPRVPNTVIDSPDENATRDDIATELTNSLDRNGRGGMLAPFRIADGTLAAPGLAFLNEPGTGMRRAAAGDMRLVVQGVDYIGFAANLVSVPNTVNVNIQGTLNAAGLTVGDVINFANPGGPLQQINYFGTGDVQIVPRNGGPLNVFELFAPGVKPALRLRHNPTAVTWVEITGGTINPSISVSSGQLIIVPPIQFLAAVQLQSTQGLYFDGGGDTLIFEEAPNVLRFMVGGTTPFRLASSQVLVSDGVPVFLDGGANTYIQHSVNDIIDFNCGSLLALRVYPNGATIQSTQRLHFDNIGDTYITELAPNVLDIVAGGNTKVRMTAAAVSNLFGQWAVPTGTPFFIDGGIDTYIIEIGPNVFDIVAGNVTKLRLVAAGVTNMFGQWAVSAATPFFFDGGINTFIREGPPDVLEFWTGNVLRANIGDAGYFRASRDGTFWAAGQQSHEFDSDGNSYSLVVAATAASPFGFRCRYVNAAPNSSGNAFLVFDDTAGTKVIFTSNGGLHNFSANNVNLSDMAVKHYWEPYTVPQLEALSAAVDYMEDGRYKYRDQTHDDWNHGYIAQNVREAFANIAPELVEEMDWGERDEMKNLLSVYGTDLVNIRLAVAKYEINKLKAEIADLKGKLQ